MIYKLFFLCLCFCSNLSIAKEYVRAYRSNEFSEEIIEDLRKHFQSEQHKVKRFLGSSSFKIMMEAEQINGYLLDPFRHDGETFGGYSIRKKGYAISRECSLNCVS